MSKNLATADAVTSMLRSNSVFVEIGGSVRRITLSALMDSINAGNTQLLRQVAWGIEIKETLQSSTDWTPIIGNIALRNEYEAMSGRYMVANDGKAAKLNPADSSVFMDGTTVIEARGHVMFCAPRLYYLVQTDAQTSKRYLWMSMIPIGGHYIEAPCFGAYKGSMSGNALVSRSGVAPTGTKTIAQFWAAAQENGSMWGLTNYDHRRFMMMKALGKYGNTDIQTSLGYGVCGSTSLDLWAAAAVLLTGATKTMGDAYGKIDISVVNGANTGVNCSRVNLGGIEDPYGWQWEMIQNVYFGTSSNSPAQTGTEMFIYEGNRLPAAGELTGIPVGNYRQLTRLTTSGYVKEMVLGGYFDLLAKVLNGGSTSYWSDYFYGNATGQLLLWGGYAYDGPSCGLASADSNNAFSNSAAVFGARPAYFGELTFMSGVQFNAATA